MTTFTPVQDEALKAVGTWLKAKPGRNGTPLVFRLFGFAGTGKTTLAREIAELARLIKGYGDTARRGIASYRRIESEIIEPALAGTLTAKVAVDAIARILDLQLPEAQQAVRDYLALASIQVVAVPPEAADGAVADIVVTGIRQSLSKGIETKRQAVTFVDSIVAEDVGKLPDNNVVEALQRVTGIQVTDRAGGETATITIRGLTDPLTTLNGRNIFTAAGTSFALQDISANLVSRVDVYKTRSADQLETGLAGSDHDDGASRAHG